MDVGQEPPAASDRAAAPRLAIVVPCFNEEQVLDETVSRLSALLTDLVAQHLARKDSFLLFVDDGSGDATWAIISEAQQRDARVAGLKLAGNAGHQKALVAGMEAVASAADCVITIDADLQDDVDAIPEFVRKYLEGYDIVYGVRRRRDSDTVFKRWSALGFYRLLRAMGADVVANHADYRLLSHRAVEHLLRFREVNLFLRGMVPLLGFRSTEVYYDRQRRFAGETKYPFKKMAAFACDGITSFSTIPLRWIGRVGAVVCLLGFGGGVAAAASRGAGVQVPGWVYILALVAFVGGLQLVALGLVGAYVGKTYQEAKRRPRYVAEAWLAPRVAADFNTPSVGQASSEQSAVRALPYVVGQ
jgi:polyisoprenyl-phosphate glycosyltransferase